MSNLTQFFNALSQQEKESINSEIFTLTEKSLYLELLIGQSQRVRQSLGSSTGLTQGHYQKISSTILQKIYTELEPRGGIHLLRFIARKSIPGVYYAEVLRQEKKIVLTMSELEREQFYFIAFHYCNSCPVDIRCLKKMKEYGEKYLLFKQDRDKFDELAVTLRFETYQFVYDSDNFEISGSRIKKYYEYLLATQELLTSNTHPLASFYLSLALMSYHQQVSHSLNGFLEAVDQVNKWRPDLIKNVSPETELFDTVLKANALMEGRQYDLAYRILVDIIDKTMYPYPPLHSMTYIISTMNTERYREAEIMLKKLIAHPEHYHHEQTFCYLYMIQSLLLQFRYDEAQDWLSKIFKRKSTQLSNNEEIIVRIYETLFALLKYDLVTAEAILKKNIQWLNRRSNKDLRGEVSLLKSFQRAITEHWSHKPISLIYHEDLKCLNIHQSKFYKEMIERILIKLRNARR
jgi:hypothetical protein